MALAHQLQIHTTTLKMVRCISFPLTSANMALLHLRNTIHTHLNKDLSLNTTIANINIVRSPSYFSPQPLDVESYFSSRWLTSKFRSQRPFFISNSLS